MAEPSKSFFGIKRAQRQAADVRGFALNLYLAVADPDLDLALQLEFKSGIFMEACPLDPVVE